jgi:exonuclease SbcC
MKLSLTNFRKYADNTFSMGTSVVKISGESGSGKSTILDAIYYVLYGKLQKVKPRNSNGATEVVMEFPYKDTTITIRRRGRNDVTVWIKEDTFEGDHAQSVIDDWFGTSDAFLVSSYLKAESMHKFISASASEKKDITYLLFPGATDCDKYVTKLKEMKKKEEELMEKQERIMTKIRSSMNVLLKNHPWLDTTEDVLVEDIEKLLTDNDLPITSTYTDIQQKMKEYSSILGRYDLLVEQCIVPEDVDTDTLSTRAEEIERILSLSTSSFLDMEKRISDCTIILSRYRTMIEQNTRPEDEDIESLSSKIEEIDNVIEERKREIGTDILSLSVLQKKVKDCYAVLGRYDVLLEQNVMPEYVDVESLQQKMNSIKDEILTSKVGSESKESTISYLKGTLDSLEQDFSPDCIKDYEPTRKLHSICPSYSVLKGQLEDLSFDINSKKETLVDYEESLSAIEHNKKLSDILTCPTCNSKLRHTDTLCLVDEEMTLRTVIFTVSRDDVTRLKMDIDTMKKKHLEGTNKLLAYDKFISEYPHLQSLIEKHGSPAQYNRYITDMKSKKDRIDSINTDIENLSKDSTKYLSRSQLELMNKECSDLDSQISTYRSDMHRYHSLQSQITSLLDANQWLVGGRQYVSNLENSVQKVHELEILISSSNDSRESMNRRLLQYKDKEDKYKRLCQSIETLLAENPWLSDGDSYIKDLESQSLALIEIKKSNDRLQKELEEIKSILEKNDKDTESYLALKSKIGTLITNNSWLNDGVKYMSMLDSISSKILNHSKNIEMKKIHTSFHHYKEKEQKVINNTKILKERISNIMRLLALVNESYRIYIKNQIESIGHDISILGKLFFDESMNISIVSDDVTERPSFDLRIEYEGIVYDDIKQLSTGERKRISLILMIVIAKHLDAKMMLLDECLSSIGQDSRGCILTELSKLGIMIIFSSHDPVPGGYFEEILLDPIE